MWETSAKMGTLYIMEKVISAITVHRRDSQVRSTMFAKMRLKISDGQYILRNKETVTMFSNGRATMLVLSVLINRLKP
jgi:hypothetical protein